MNITADYSCKEAARLLTARRDRALSEEEDTNLKHHLSECLNCRNFDAQLETLSTLAKRYATGAD